jgi:choline-sulfatase
MHPADSLQLPPWRDNDLDEKMERARVFRDLIGYGTMTEQQIRERVSMYYGMIRFVDDAVGQILDALDRTNLAEDTVVVFTSDHGDYASERRLTDKSSTLVDAMTRVPLLVSFRGRVPEGAVDRHPVSLLDVLPTCLGLAGISRPAECEGVMLPDTGDDPPRDAVFSEYGAGGPRLRLADLPRLVGETDQWHGERPLLRWREAEGRAKMVRLGSHKYVYDPMDEIDELYDLNADPWELRNLAREPAYGQVRARLRDRLLDWSVATEGSRPTPLYFDPVAGRNTETPSWGPAPTKEESQ